MTSKNTVILHNTEFGTFNFTVLHSHELFNRNEMVNLLEAIENKIYVYDDIINIDVTNLLEINIIDDLPKKLQKLKIVNTTLNILIIPEQCNDIKSIEIKESNLETIPEIFFLTKLHTLAIENSNISKLPSIFPSSLKNINLNGNLLNSINCDLTEFPKNIPIILFNNKFSEKKQIPEYQFCFGSQNSKNTFRRITNYTIQQNEARNQIRLTLDRDRVLPLLNYDAYNFDYYNNNFINPHNINNMNVIPPPNIRPPEITLFNSNQTVHISSICNSVTKSIQKIIELTNGIYKRVPQETLINEFMDEFYNHKTWLNTITKFFKFTTIECETQRYIRNWINDASVHTKTNVRYVELLARVWILIDEHKMKQDFIKNVKIELDASVGMCFTGRINRLVNSLIGFIDGITVGISIKEQLQLEIGKIMAKLGIEEINYNEAVKEITALFEDPDVLEDETVTSYYKAAWIDALEDYKKDTEEDINIEESKLLKKDTNENIIIEESKVF
jgi:hypothetical protein